MSSIPSWAKLCLVVDQDNWFSPNFQSSSASIIPPILAWGATEGRSSRRSASLASPSFTAWACWQSLSSSGSSTRKVEIFPLTTWHLNIYTLKVQIFSEFVGHIYIPTSFNIMLLAFLLSDSECKLYTRRKLCLRIENILPTRAVQPASVPVEPSTPRTNQDVHVEDLV